MQDNILEAKEESCQTISCISEELCAVANDNSEPYGCKALYYLALVESKWSKRFGCKPAVSSSTSTADMRRKQKRSVAILDARAVW